MNFQTMVSFFRYIDKKNLRNSGILLGIIIFFVMVCLVPAVKSNKELKIKCNDLENNTIRSVKKIDNHSQLKKEKEETEEYVNRYLGRLLEERDKTRLIGDVSDMAKQSQVNIISMRQQQFNRVLPESFLAYVKPLCYELTLECGYHQFGNFINKIETFDVILHVEEFYIEPNESDDKQHMIKLVLSTYAKI
jgi:Tfp pilus assembly protein PilO